MNQSRLINGFQTVNHLPALPRVEPSKHTYLDNRVIKSQREKKGKRLRSQGAQERLLTKRHLIALASELTAGELAQKIEQCHAFVSTLTCGKHVARIIPNATCEFRLCPDCARRRSRKLINKHLPTMRAFVQTHRSTPVHLVLTQTHREETRKESLKRLRDSFTKLQRRAFWKEHFKGGTWSVEFTKGADGLHHTHFHIIGFRSKFFDINLLREEWKAVTGDSHVLNLKPITDLTSGLLEVFKYISKPLDTKRFTKADLADFLRLRNMQLFGTFGEYRKFSSKYKPSDNDTDPLATDLEGLNRNLSEGCACPHCDQPLFELRMSPEGLVDFYKGLEMSPPAPKRPPS
jgi:diadenosine tetraphosphate (Ap4A) HIT family hydrolase